jgi:hypothetical protein
MFAIWIFLIASVGILVASIYYGALDLFSGRRVMLNDAPTPRWFWPFCICFGLFGVFSSAPGIIFHQPWWFIDKVFWVISKM